MMELKGEEAGLKCQLSGATCWFRIEISISQGLGIVSLVFQVYLLLSGSSNISNSKNKFSISHCLSLTITLPKVLRCWWLHTNQILCSKVHDNIPTKVQDYRLPPMCGSERPNKRRDPPWIYVFASLFQANQFGLKVIEGKWPSESVTESSAALCTSWS